MSVKRYVYPKLDRFFQERGMSDKATQLTIARECEDGSNWYGVEKAVESYCKEYGCSIACIEWAIKVHPDDMGFVSIKATDIEDWKRQFNELGAEFVPIG